MVITHRRSEDGEQLTIAIRGRFDFNQHEAFRVAFRDHTDCTRFCIDLSATEYMDSSALGMLLLLREHAGQDSPPIVISGASPAIRRILTIANFDKLFDLV